MHRERGQGQQDQDESRGEAALFVLVAPVVDGGGGRSGVSESAGAARRPEDAGGRFAEVAERGRRGVRRVAAVAVETSLLIANLARLLEGPLLTLLLVGIVAPCLLSAGDGKRSAEENGKIWGKYPFAIVNTISHRGAHRRRRRALVASIRAALGRAVAGLVLPLASQEVL